MKEEEKAVAMQICWEEKTRKKEVRSQGANAGVKPGYSIERPGWTGEGEARNFSGGIRGTLPSFAAHSLMAFGHFFKCFLLSKP